MRVMLPVGIAFILLLITYRCVAQDGGLLANPLRRTEFQELFPADAKIEKVAGGFQFTEGPVWHKDGYLLFTDIPANAIVKLDPDGKVTTYRKPSGNANGLTFDKKHRLIACEHANRRVTREEKDASRNSRYYRDPVAGHRDKEVVVLASRYKGKRLNSPNDVVVTSDGSIYFTDPPYAVSPEDRELTMQGVFRISPKGEVTLVADDLDRPNGLAFSPDEKKLYITDSSERMHIRVLDVKADGTLENSRVFARMQSEESGVPDGIKVDERGNLWATGPGGVWVFDKSGKRLGTIKPPETPANCAWGDEDGKTLYITARTSIYRIKTNVKGIRPWMAQSNATSQPE